MGKDFKLEVATEIIKNCHSLGIKIELFLHVIRISG